MKKLTILLAAVLFTAMSTMAQVAINTDDTDANESAILDVKSTTMGLLPPRMLQAQMDAIANPATGLMVYCTDCAPGSVRVYDGFNWVESNGYPAGLGENEIYNYKTGKIWMDRNLGASQVATAKDDYLAYGSLYQWGRASDGHELINWTSSTSGTPVNGTYGTQATTAVPDLGNPWDELFITGFSNWLNPADDYLWQGVSGTNNPCPSGFRLPTETELNDECLSWAPDNNSDGAFTSLKLVVCGYRSFAFGTLNGVGDTGRYWSSSVDGSRAWLMTANSDEGYMGSSHRENGYSIRCLKD